MASPLCQGRLRWEGSLLPSHSGYGPATKLPTLTQSLVRDRWQRGPCQQTSHSHALQRCRSRGLVPCSYCCATDFWLAKSHCKMRCSSRAPSLSEELCPPSVMAFPACSSSMGAALCDSSARPCWLCPLSRGMCRWGTGRWAREAILHGIPSSTPSVRSPAPARGS